MYTLYVFLALKNWFWRNVQLYGVGLGEKTLTFGKTLSNLEMLNTFSKAALLVEAELASQD